MAGGVQNSQAHVARLVLVAIGQRHVGKVCVRRFVKEDCSARGRGELARPRDVIGLNVRLQDVSDAHALLGGGLQIRLDILLWIHHSARVCAASAEQVAGAARLRQEELTENHWALLRLVLRPRLL